MTRLPRLDWDVIRFLPIQFQSRAVTIGFPGAGNVLANRICSEILIQSGITDSFGPPDSEASDCRVADRILNTIGARWNAMLSHFRSALPPGAESYFQHDSMGASNFIATLDRGAFLIVRKLDVAGYFISRIHSTHELPSAAVWTFFRSKGFKTILTIRHPLAIIASFAAKAVDPNNEIVRGEVMPAGVPVADVMMAARLGSPAWVVRTARLVERYYRLVLDQAEPPPIVRFEEALKHPASYVEALAEHLSVPISKQTAETISHAIGTKAFAPGHFNKPTLDRWRRLFGKEDFDAIDATGLFSTFERLGYPRPNPSDLEPMHDDHLRLRALAQDRSVRNDKGLNFEWDYRALIGTFESNDLAKALGAAGYIFTARLGEFEIVANDKQILDDYVSRLSGAAFAMIGRSGAHDRILKNLQKAVSEMKLKMRR